MIETFLWPWHLKLLAYMISSPICASQLTLYFQCQKCNHNKHVCMQLSNIMHTVSTAYGWVLTNTCTSVDYGAILDQDQLQKKNDPGHHCLRQLYRKEKYLILGLQFKKNEPAFSMEQNASAVSYSNCPFWKAC